MDGFVMMWTVIGFVLSVLLYLALCLQVVKYLAIQTIRGYREVLGEWEYGHIVRPGREVRDGILREV
jgi:hypothetical protein